MLESTREKLLKIGFICCSYILILSFFVHYEKIDLTDLKSITENLYDSPIINITLPVNGKCNNSKKIKLGEHKTKTMHCICKEKFHLGMCSYEEIRNGCKTSEPRKKSYIYNWDGNQFCTKTYNIPYVNLIDNIINYNEFCKEGFKNCGFIDTLKHKLCLIKSDICPVNNIEISNNKNPSNNKFNYQTLILKKNKYLHFTNEDVNNNIISSLNFLKEKDQLKHRFNKKRYNFLDKELKKNLFEDNKLYISEENFNNSNISLYAGTFYGFKKEYLKTKPNFKYILDELKKYRTISIFWETIICFIVLFIIINELMKIQKREENLDLLELALFDIIKVIIVSTFCYFTLIEFLKTANFGLPDNESDEDVNQIFIDYNKNLTIVCLFALSKFLVSLFLLIIVLINIFEGDCKDLFEAKNTKNYDEIPINENEEEEEEEE